MTWSRRTWVAVILTGALVSVGYLYAAIFLAPKLASDRVTSTVPAAQSAARASERGSVRTSMLAVFAGAIGAFGAVYTARTFALNRRGQITERFTRAVDQLGEADKLAVRLGGIYALERIASESAADHRAIVYLLAAYIRENSPWPPRDLSTAGETFGPSEATEDIQAIVAVLRRRDIGRERRERIRIGLQDTNLCRTRAAGIRLVDSDLSGAQMQESVLVGANLRRAVLRGTNMRDAKLGQAIMSSADLTRADLTSADLTGANLEQADLTGADLTAANLTAADLTGANLEQADLTGASLAGADLTRANLTGADLTGADLEHADLTRAILTEAKLEGANLTGARGLHGDDDA